jgi:DNA-binding transcriptional ArsR family regulator
MRGTNRSKKRIPRHAPHSRTTLRQRSAARTGLAGAASVFAALGDQTRLRLVARLCAEGPLPIVRLSNGLALTRQAVTKHLYALAGAGLVRTERKGRERIWQVKVGRLAHAQRWLDSISELGLRGKSHLLRHHDRVTAKGRELPAHRRSLKTRRHVGID